RSAGAARRSRGGAGGRARRPARGAPQPRPGGDLPRACAEVERELSRTEPGDGGRPGTRSGAAAEGAARRLLVRPQARARRGLRLPARRSARLRDELSAGRARRPSLLRAVRQRRGERGGERLVGVAAEDREDRELERLGREAPRTRDHDTGALGEREAADSRAECGQCERTATELVGELE